MRMSYWSSDVCSSDPIALQHRPVGRLAGSEYVEFVARRGDALFESAHSELVTNDLVSPAELIPERHASQDLGVAEQDVSLIDQLGNVRHQIEQAQIVADVFARLADARANLGVLEIEQLAQPLPAQIGRAHV